MKKLLISFSGGETSAYMTYQFLKNNDYDEVVVIFANTGQENEESMWADMVKTAKEMLEVAGYQNITDRSKMSYPGNANHEMGTARMGRDPKTSVLNGFNQMHAVKNVFITDGSCMTSSSCVNPSLTFMALTARACAFAVEQLKKNKI